MCKNIFRRDKNVLKNDGAYINEKVGFASKESASKVLERFALPSNITAETIRQQRQKYGANILSRKKPDSLAKRLFNAFVNPFTAILSVLAIVSLFTDVILPKDGNVNLTTIVIITIMVMISGFLRFIQETRSGNAARRLSAMIKTTAAIERNGQIQEIHIDEIVVGDMLHLSAGDMIPADLRILQSKDLFISQSALTGESEPVEKFSTPSEAKNILDSHCIAFAGSNIVSGSAKAIVVSVGDETIFGEMAKLISNDPTKTAFEKGVNSVSWVLIRFMLVMVPVVFFINGFTKGDWKDAFLFAISVAVGLTPEMLPMIVTTCLSKGAVSMSKKKTIVKTLNSIQNLGSIDILCTDKTGTLTQDKVVLEFHLNVEGKEDERVMRHGFLNSYFQTGLKNLMDIAIINRIKEEPGNLFSAITEKYHKVDEIPFDFVRRRMSVVVATKENNTLLITKGAVEEILSICTRVEYKGNIVTLTDELKSKVLRTIENLNDEGMRVIAVAQKDEPDVVGSFDVKDESEMILIGYLAFLDPPKESASLAIKALAKYGVKTKVLTGDNDRVTKSICKHVGIDPRNILLGSDIEVMDDQALSKALEDTYVFAKLSPAQKARIVSVLRGNGHIVGFLGDGINDAAAMKASDVGISVDTAVDIAKESADIILLEKNLMVLKGGIVEGRKTHANMIKYMKITASSNFGNMFSVLIASAFLPFLPMMSLQLILLNLIYDISCTAIPWDNVDKEFLLKPRRWDVSLIGRFMIWLGPTSSIFDITTYLIMYFLICPAMSGGLLFHQITDSSTQLLYIAIFQTGWFVESMWTQTLVIHTIRTPKIPFLQSSASFPVIVLTSFGIAVVTLLPYTFFGEKLGLSPLPMLYFYWLAGTVSLYMLLAQTVKNLYIKKYGELL